MTHNKFATSWVSFGPKNRIQVLSFSSCDKIANCRELVACAEFAASDIQTHIVCVWDQRTHDFVTQKRRKRTTHSKPMTSWVLKVKAE